MSRYRLLLDENVEHEVRARLVASGHDVVHLDRASGLEKGASDLELARWAATRDRTIVTYDDDFVAEVPESEYRAVLFFEDDALSAAEMAAVIDSMSDSYPYEAVEGLQKAGREWL